MGIKEVMLPEFDHEMGTTRKLLERVPWNDASWKPHPKSMSLGELAGHLAEMPGWVGTIMQDSSFDMVSGGDGRATFGSTKELLAAFDQSVAKARAAIAARTDAEMMAPWTLKKAGEDLFTVPKVGVLRTFLLNHVIHHRGQLSVYLRLRDVPVPSIYGPSADEKAL